jgi:hypothetical protein
MVKKIQEKQHFSSSQLDHFCLCPESYRQWYIEKNRVPPTVHMARGTGMHAGAAFNLAQKIKSGVDLPRQDIIAAGVAEFEAATRDGLMLTRDEAEQGAKSVVASVKDDLVAILDCHAKTQAPDYQPIFVEQAVRIELPKAPRDLLAVLDVGTIDEVSDFKTAKRSKSQADLDSSIQLTVYSIAFAVLTGDPPKTVALDTIVQTKKETKRQKLVGTRDEADYQALANRINAVQHAIDAGSFPPAMPGSWKCSEKYCGYFRSCPFVNGSRSQGD